MTIAREMAVSWFLMSFRTGYTISQSLVLFPAFSKNKVIDALLLIVTSIASLKMHMLSQNVFKEHGFDDILLCELLSTIQKI